MAGWTAITAGVNWQDVDFVNEYIKASNERSLSTPLTEVAGGEAIQRTPWYSIQMKLESAVGSATWAKSHEADGTKRASDYWDGDTDLALISGSDLFWTLATWRTSAGIASGFRRATTWPTDWTDYSDAAYVAAGYGFMQEGDILGPWIFVDLQEGLNRLIWRPIIDVSVSWQHNDVATLWSPSNSSHAVWATAKAAAQANYAAYTPIKSAFYPFAEVTGTLVSSVYTADYGRRAPYGQVTGLPILKKCEVDFYAFLRAAKWTDTGWTANWDDQGLGFTENAWNLWHSNSATQTATVLSSSTFGGGTIPNDLPAAPSAWPLNKQGQGYEGGYGRLGIARFDVTDGFEHY